ncbi:MULTISPECIES: iron-containing redox enzyme family protein [unclassified Streptomyces]|uniref:iron-containing redox enzyme family protein n=1 Tax=unclassified Streptomyces TaxID=2593676 RepID=UPI001367A890|nr:MULTISPECIES: iron-containing redox enzyme family protein [unclassified Streptomyces]MCW5251167.1 iron-containing redox enzyme family protein [Streptomyces sp. SHP 1-2]MYU23211.1 iron-containing redox enzyme family protein [Streptomyces sp. SID8352]
MLEVSSSKGQAPPLSTVDRITALLGTAPEKVDSAVAGAERERFLAEVAGINRAAAEGDMEALYAQQYLLDRIYQLYTRIPSGENAEGSVFVYEVGRLLETATAAAQDALIAPELLDGIPTDPREYLSWLKHTARGHRVYKHPYYHEFIRNTATESDLRNYVMQESVVDGRFDDLLALMQVGTSGDAKMEIAANFWDEMGNGDHAQVHTTLFNKIFEVFEISDDELERSLTATSLLNGNLAVMLSRHRSLYPEAVGFLGMTEWMAPDRFVQVVHAWERLGLPEVGITYHRLHITIDSQHAQGWFHNVVLPAAESAHMRRAIARGILWRLNSSAAYLDERMPSAA